MLKIIDDDEWFELSLTLNAIVAELPPGSEIVESMAMPPFRAAIQASGVEIPSVVTLPYINGQPTHREAVAFAMTIAEPRAAQSPDGALTVAVTQTDDAGTIAIVVAGLPGERCSFSSFELRPGSHQVDVGFEVLRMLQGWAIRSHRGADTDSGSAAA